MTAIWSCLRPGEPIGVAALSGPVLRQRLQAGLAHLRAWGHPVLVAANTFARTDYLAGSDDQRLAGLEWLLDQGVRRVIASRGGYGVTRLLHRLPWQRLVRDQVSFVGFSDLTALLNPLLARGGAAQVHGPMTAGLHRHLDRRRLRRLLSEGPAGNPTLFRFPPDSIVRPGRAAGVAMGGNLTMLAALVGTSYEPDYSGAVLFLEEVGEPLYRLDRLLTQLARSGRLSRVTAIVGGSLTGCRPACERDRLWRRLLAEAAPDDAAIVVGLPFGHGAGNMAFPVGVPVLLDTAAGKLSWVSGDSTE